MNNSIEATERQVRVEEETQKTEMTKAEICFGAIMAIAAISGMWFVVSLMINYFIGA